MVSFLRRYDNSHIILVQGHIYRAQGGPKPFSFMFWFCHLFPQVRLVDVSLSLLPSIYPVSVKFSNPFPHAWSQITLLWSQSLPGLLGLHHTWLRNNWNHDLILRRPISDVVVLNPLVDILTSYSMKVKERWIDTRLLIEFIKYRWDFNPCMLQSIILTIHLSLKSFSNQCCPVIPFIKYFGSHVILYMKFNHDLRNGMSYFFGIVRSRLTPMIFVALPWAAK